MAVATHTVQSWHRNWDELTAFFEFPVEIRKIIYTSNIIENLNGMIRSTQNQSFRSEPMMLFENQSGWLLQEIDKKWTTPIHNWGVVMNQFIAIFE